MQRKLGRDFLKTQFYSNCAELSLFLAGKAKSLLSALWMDQHLAVVSLFISLLTHLTFFYFLYHLRTGKVQSSLLSPPP